MKEFYKDIKHWIDYDYVVINDNLKKCYKEISGIINNVIFKKNKISFNKKKIEKHVIKLVS